MAEARRTAAALILAGAAAAFMVGCRDPVGNDPNVVDNSFATATACPLGDASGCARPPSYADEIAPLVQRACMPCHGPGGVAADNGLTTRAELQMLETTVIAQVNGCAMPPADAGPDATMTPADRTELDQWFVCGSPN